MGEKIRVMSINLARQRRDTEKYFKSKASTNMIEPGQ